ncbi:MAG TPA: putative O-glycosylation ligase, exosortase A system-associated [Candidatus Acidoferrum sp.]|nr:putative O-glycosylation ligase, exosortase A system-associated [Candidatus Acidoferrum sp.]
MRDVILFVIIAVSVPISFFRPYFGILMWTWITFFNPHRFTWGFMYNFPIAAVIAVPTLIGCLFTTNINKQFMKWETLLLAGLWLWFCVTYLHAMQVPLFEGHLADAKLEWIRVSKVLLITFAMILLVTSHQRLKSLVMVTAMSFGILAIKGAVFGFRTSGESRVWGPPDSFITDNNSFALAVNMSLPMLLFLARDEKRRALRWLLYLAFACGVLSVALTYSRGGLLGLAAVLFAISLKSRYKLISGFLVATAFFGVLTFAPPQWMARMAGLAHGDVDMSGHQRLVSWGTSWNFAMDYPITGGSFNALPDVEIFQRYQTEPLPGGFLSSGPHSIYFQTLEEQGFVGLGLYLVLVGSCWASLLSLRRRAARSPSTQWVVPYTHMIEVSLFGFLVSGAFLGLANFDLFYQLIAMVIILKMLYRSEVAAPAPVRAEESEPIDISAGALVTHEA